MAELQRLLLSPKRIIILLMIAVINLAMFSGYCRADREEALAYYNSMRMFGVNVQNEEHRKTKQYLEQDYSAYLEYVQGQSQSQSILGKLTKKNSYVDRNSAKTGRDYKRLTGLTLEDGENRGINAVKDYAITDYLLLIAPLLLILELLADADTAAGDLVRATRNGRVQLCAWRILAVLLLSAASVLLLYGGNILFTCKFYGAPGFFRSIQSIPEYQVCARRLTVGGCLLAAGCMKVLALTGISLAVWVILGRFHPLAGWTISALWLGSSWLLHRFIVPTSGINYLKFLNVFAALDADIFFTQYCNLNFFGRPVGFLGAALLFCGILLLAGIVLCLVLIGCAYPKKVGARMESVRDRFAQFLTRHLSVHSLFGFEGWKLLIAQKGLLLLIITGLLGFSLWKDIRVYVPVDTGTARFYKLFSGEVTQDKIERAAYIISGEMKKIRSSHIALGKAYLERSQLDKSDAAGRSRVNRHIGKIQDSILKSQQELTNYQKCMNSMLSLAQYTKRTGRPAWLIRSEAYMVMLHDSAAEHRCCMVLLIYLILAFSGIGAYDNRYDTRMLLRSTRRGRLGLISAQTLWVMLLTALAVTGLHGVYLLHMILDAGLDSLDAPAQSMAILQWIPFSVSMRGVIVLHMLLRYLAALAVTAGICVISRFSRTPQKALLTAMVIFLLPSALAESGITQLQFLNFVQRLTCCIHR